MGRVEVKLMRTLHIKGAIFPIWIVGGGADEHHMVEAGVNGGSRRKKYIQAKICFKVTIGV